jgi:hypothetical protein
MKLRRPAPIPQDFDELNCELLAAEMARQTCAIYYPNLLSIGLNSAETCKMSPPLPSFATGYISLILMELSDKSAKTAKLGKRRPQKLTFYH